MKFTVQSRARRRSASRSFLAICAASLAILGGAYALGTDTLFADKNSARVVRLLGKARAMSASAEDWRPLRVGSAVSDGDRIETGPNSRMILRYKNIEIRLGPNTRSRVDALLDAARPSRIHVESGYSWFSVKKQPNKGPTRFQVSTPTAIASVRGTKFSVVETEEGAVSCVCEGKVDTAPADSKNGKLAPTGMSHSYSKEGELLEKDFTQYFRGLKVDRKFQEKIEADKRLSYCTSCHKMTDLATDNSEDPSEY